jgi:succinate dehydrogenase/fumarate reductase cytochrome b subunit
MTNWQIALVANAVIAGAYFAIVAAIVIPLARSHQLKSNPLGAATAAVFFTCAVHHGAIAVHMLLPSLGVSDPQGISMREAWGWPLMAWDVIGAIVAVCYWSLRRNYGSLMQGAQLFVDLRQREQQALELNDTVLQGLVVAKMALDLDQPTKAQEALTASISSASRIITGLFGSKLDSLDLLRSTPAAVGNLNPAFQKISDEINQTAAKASAGNATDPDRAGR